MASLVDKKVRVLLEAFSTLAGASPQVGFLLSNEIYILSEALLTLKALQSCSLV